MDVLITLLISFVVVFALLTARTFIADRWHQWRLRSRPDYRRIAHLERALGLAERGLTCASCGFLGNPTQGPICPACGASYDLSILKPPATLKLGFTDDEALRGLMQSFGRQHMRGVRMRSGVQPALPSAARIAEMTTAWQPANLETVLDALPEHSWREVIALDRWQREATGHGLYAWQRMRDGKSVCALTMSNQPPDLDPDPDVHDLHDENDAIMSVVEAGEQAGGEAYAEGDDPYEAQRLQRTQRPVPGRPSPWR